MGMAMASAVVIGALVWVVSEVLRSWGRRRRGRLPPGPWGLPVLGNLLELALGGELPHKAMAKLSQKHGPIVFLRLGCAPTILVSDSSAARACLSGRNEKIFVSRPPMGLIGRLPYGRFPGVVMAPYGDEWRHGRKLYTHHIFTMKRVGEFEPIRRSQIMEMLRAIEGQAGQPMNLTQAIGRVVEDTMCRMLLGKPLAEIVDAKLGVDMQTLVRRVDELFQIPMIGDFIPALGFLDRKLKAKVDEFYAQLDTLISSVIHERQQRPPGSPQVILDVLLESLDINQAKTMIAELIAASTHTTSTVLNWAMIELVRNPHAMKRLQMELDQVTKGENRILKENEIGNLVYLKASLKETMRLHAPTPLLVPHMSIEECEVEGYTIPKETRLIVNLWAIGRDPKIWEEPEKFMPERFLTKEGALLDFHGQHFEFLPFGGGRRICPGIGLALSLLGSAIANLVYAFGWTLPPGHRVDLSECFGTIVTCAQPLMVIPHLRHQA